MILWELLCFVFALSFIFVGIYLAMDRADRKLVHKILSDPNKNSAQSQIEEWFQAYVEATKEIKLCEQRLEKEAEKLRKYNGAVKMYLYIKRYAPLSAPELHEIALDAISDPEKATLFYDLVSQPEVQQRYGVFGIEKKSLEF